MLWFPPPSGAAADLCYWCVAWDFRGQGLAAEWAPACLCMAQDAVKGSQGAGKVDESLDRTNVTGGLRQHPLRAVNLVEMVSTGRISGLPCHWGLAGW